MSHLDILPQLFPCIGKIWTTCSESYLQSFANNLPNMFTNGVIYFSVLLCQKEWRYHFQNHSTSNKRGEKYGHKKDRKLTPHGYSLSKAYGCLPSKRPALCTHISGAESLECPNSVIMGSDMEFKG